MDVAARKKTYRFGASLCAGTCHHPKCNDIYTNVKWNPRIQWYKNKCSWMPAVFTFDYLLRPHTLNLLYFFFSVAEASCRSAIDAAKNIVADVGHETAASSTGLVELARSNEHSSERDCKRILTKKYGLALPLKKTILDTEGSSVKLPVLSLATWLKYMLEKNCWHMLTGLIRPDEQRSEAILTAFWSNYRNMCPSHEVFGLESSGQVVLSRCCPIVLHGDEGRGRKHSAYLVVSWRSLLGRGLHPAERDQRSRGGVRKPYLKQKCNYIGHSFCTRFMVAGLRKTEYSGDNAATFGSLMAFCAQECHHMATVGMKDERSGKQFWLMTLHITGDWPWLVKSGSLSRSFANVMKSQNQQRAKGICHICAAGQDSVPFEQVATTRPKCWDTQFQDPPSQVVSPFSILPHNRGEFGGLWAFDFFHTFHLGVARVWIGGALALLSMQENGSNIEDRFSSLTARYKAWCLQTRHRACIQRLTKECISWVSSKQFPVGTWHKGELSTVLMKFLEAVLPADRDYRQEPLLTLVAQGTFAINEAIRIMYRADLWLTPEESSRMSGYGLRFLRRFSDLGRQGQVRGMNLFLMQPKIHVLQKIYLKLHFAAKNNIFQLNPLSVSVQQCEDFIGRPSRLSRRVNSGNVANQRVLDRYLQSAYSEWISSGYLVRPAWASQFSDVKCCSKDLNHFAWAILIYFHIIQPKNYRSY